MTEGAKEAYLLCSLFPVSAMGTLRIFASDLPMAGMALTQNPPCLTPT